MNWIPCGGKLPENPPESSVLIITDIGIQAVAYLDWEQGWPPNDFWRTGDGRIEVANVTHWMPLPPKPEATPAPGDNLAPQPQQVEQPKSAKDWGPIPPPAAINRAIAEILGVKPELEGWMAHKDGASCMYADRKEDVEKWLAQLPAGSWAKSYEPKPRYRYPDYHGDLNVIMPVVRALPDKEFHNFTVTGANMAHWKHNSSTGTLHARYRECFAPDAPWLCEAFLRTHGKWNHGQLELGEE